MVAHGELDGEAAVIDECPWPCYMAAAQPLVEHRHEGRELYSKLEETPQGLSGRPATRPCVRHLQVEPALQSPSGQLQKEALIFNCRS